MLNRIIEWSVRNVFLVLLGTAFVVGAGIYALVKTPLDAIPDLSDVQVLVYRNIQVRHRRWWRIRSPIR